MAVYVDDYRRRATVRRLTANWSHLLADTEEELVVFGERIGLLAGWLQYPGTPKVHFDVTDSVRARAIRAGASAITYRQAGLIVARKRRVGQGERAQTTVQTVLSAAGLPAPGDPPPDRRIRPWNPNTRQHGWLKQREHVYRCYHCDLVKENRLTAAGWVVLWHWPDNTTTVERSTPKCPGPVDP